MKRLCLCPAVEKRKKRLAFYQSASVVVSPESSPYYPPVLMKETDAHMRSKNTVTSPPQLHKEAAALLSSPDSGPRLPPPMKKAKPLSFSDESPSASQTSTTKSDVVDFTVFKDRLQFLAEAFPEVPRQVTVQLTLFV